MPSVIRFLQIRGQTDRLTDRLTTNCSSLEIQDLGEHGVFWVGNSCLWTVISNGYFFQSNTNEYVFLCFEFCCKCAQINSNWQLTYQCKSKHACDDVFWCAIIVSHIFRILDLMVYKLIKYIIKRYLNWLWVITFYGKRQ